MRLGRGCETKRAYSFLESFILKKCIFDLFEWKGCLILYMFPICVIAFDAGKCQQALAVNFCYILVINLFYGSLQICEADRGIDEVARIGIVDMALDILEEMLSSQTGYFVLGFVCLLIQMNTVLTQ